MLFVARSLVILYSIVLIALGFWVMGRIDAFLDNPADSSQSDKE